MGPLFSEEKGPWNKEELVWLRDRRKGQFVSDCWSDQAKDFSCPLPRCLLPIDLAIQNVEESESIVLKVV